MKFSTKSIHAGEEPDFREGASGDVIAPLHLSTTFARQEVETPTAGLEYSRSSNPTRNTLEQKLAAIEKAQFGLAFASGLAAETSILMALLKTGDHVIATDDLYGGTQRLFRKVFATNYGINFSFVDTSIPAEIKSAITEKTKLIWVESPTNPLLKLSDIAEIATIAKQNGIVVVVDNTFMSPFFQNPLELGADIVLHSTSKYINGHSDSIGGAVMVNDKGLFEKIQFIQNSAGAILSPFDSYIVLRGIKTLSMRMKRHAENAQLIAEFLERHPRVKRVVYPGLASHPQFSLAKRQMSGFGGMISAELNGDLSGAEKFLKNLHYFSLAESLGGVESLIELPALMTHSSVPTEDRIKLGITDTLIRISVGVEDADDLINDIEAALEAV
ncbi:Cystathionine gamma-lyase [hydrothermal vent metagenome]|uniref:Cystathionine gamma-lyase n=1 Tax=hydrothermal vent metagenome TaxID=652676 RepID=A0A3B0UA95_9ZZZZ